MNMLNFILLNDSSHMLDKLSKMLEAIFIKNSLNAEIVLKTTNENDVLSYLGNNSTDVIIFDIKSKANALSCLDLAKKIRTTNKSIYFIFLT